MLSEEPTPRELERRLDKIDTSIERGFEQINGRLDQMVSTEVFQMYKQGADHRIGELERGQQRTDQRVSGLESSAVTRKGVYLLVGAVCGILSVLAGIASAYARFLVG